MSSSSKNSPSGLYPCCLLLAFLVSLDFSLFTYGTKIMRKTQHRKTYRNPPWIYLWPLSFDIIVKNQILTHEFPTLLFVSIGQFNAQQQFHLTQRFHVSNDASNSFVHVIVLNPHYACHKIIRQRNNAKYYPTYNTKRGQLDVVDLQSCLRSASNCNIRPKCSLQFRTRSKPKCMSQKTRRCP